MIPEGVVYLENSGIEIEGLTIWGSPITLHTKGMAFTASQGKEIKKVWDIIPVNTDILITQMPPLVLKGDIFLGSEELLKRVNIVRPKIHCFGNGHSWFRVKERQSQTSFVNASTVFYVPTDELGMFEGEEYNDNDDTICIRNAVYINLEDVSKTNEILFLNNLNQLLIRVEKEIKETVVELLIVGEKLYRERGALTNGFAVEAIIDYQAKDNIDLFYGHRFFMEFSYQAIIVEKNFGVLQDSLEKKDIYRVAKMPLLDDPYCYTLRNLLDHDNKDFSIYDLDTIEIDVRYGEQKYFKIRKDGTNKKIPIATKQKELHYESMIWHRFYRRNDE